jgi:hypothetical protein
VDDYEDGLDSDEHPEESVVAVGVRGT